MTTVPMEKHLAEELVDFKLHYMQREIQKILSSWKYKSATEFLLHAKNGTLREAEEDAITLKQLLADREKFFALKSNWSKI